MSRNLVKPVIGGGWRGLGWRGWGRARLESKIERVMCVCEKSASCKRSETSLFSRNPLELQSLATTDKNLNSPLKPPKSIVSERCFSVAPVPSLAQSLSIQAIFSRAALLR